MIFTQNEWSRQSLINDYQVPAERIRNVGFGINVNPFTGHKDYTKKNILIILRRTMEVLKGLPLLYDAFVLFKKKFPEAKLSVVGTTYKEAEGIEYYENYPREKTIELLKECTLYAMPSLYEPNGITYLEALAYKTPILGLNRFALPEFAGQGKYGFIVNDPDPKEIAEKIETAFKDPDLLRKMGEEGQKATVNYYTWDKAIDRMFTELNLL